MVLTAAPVVPFLLLGQHCEQRHVLVTDCQGERRQPSNPAPAAAYAQGATRCRTHASGDGDLRPSLPPSPVGTLSFQMDADSLGLLGLRH